MKIIGIDPGTATTGYGVIETPFLNSRRKPSKLKGNKNTKTTENFSCIKYGLIKTVPKLPMAERLLKIHTELEKLINEYRPDAIAVENVYFFKNL
jgi:crossover junction endodeoxyribonuclease RuvC